MADIDLSSLFAESESTEVDWGGPLHSLYELPTDGVALTVRFRSAIAEPTQGVRLKVRGGVLKVGQVVSKDLILWHDTAPRDTLVRIDWKSAGPRSLKIWNTWRVNGVTQAWIGNAGMRVAAEGGAYDFRCSDGEGLPDFADLVVEVLFAD